MLKHTQIPSLHTLWRAVTKNLTQTDNVNCRFTAVNVLSNKLSQVAALPQFTFYE